MSLLEQNTIKKKWVDDENVSKLNVGNESGEYEVEAIRDSAIYAKEVDGDLPGLYYLVTWKGYLEEKNTWEPSLPVMHFRKMISTFYKDHSEKSIVRSPLLDTTPPITRLTVSFPVKQKQRQLKNALQNAPSEATKRNPSQFGFQWS